MIAAGLTTLQLRTGKGLSLSKHIVLKVEDTQGICRWGLKISLYLRRLEQRVSRGNSGSKGTKLTGICEVIKHNNSNDKCNDE